ncbi:histidine phosphatase family protein [Kitasatospora sp. NPDC085879]|uniref:histidine phosphatase family protein n=1 Tax=Kitasatospora sp. NPDC085879 TaxID=3154769 RepID=UPI0034319DD6
MSEAARQARFDDGGPLDAHGLRAAEAAAGTLRPAGRVLVSPSPRCRQTAEALGLPAPVDEPALAGCDAGRWRGRTLDEVAAAEPEALARWLADSTAAPHGGEPLRALLDRVADWLTALPEDTPAVTAVVEPDTVRAAAVHALGAPPAAFWRLDVRPLTATHLSGRSGRWNLGCGRPL